MLARLEAMKDRAAVEVDRSGTLVRVTPGDRAPEVRDMLVKSGATAEILDASAGAKAVATATVWFSRTNVRELTREEFRILARRWADAVKGSVEISSEQAAALVAALDAGIDRAIASMPLEDGIPKDARVWRATKRRMVDQAIEEMRSKLTPKQAEGVRAGLDEQIE